MGLRKRTAVIVALSVLIPAATAHAEGDEPIQQSESPKYVFPFSRVPVRYARDHLDYPATDVYGCYAKVHAPTAGTIGQVRRKDKWIESVDAPGTRGGLTITLLGDDGVRYYFSHLGRVKVRMGQRVEAGHWIGVMGSSGNARRTQCHTHIGMSRICPNAEFRLLQGEIWPWRYLDAWRKGVQLSPRKEKNEVIRTSPNACFEATADARADAANARRNSD